MYAIVVEKLGNNLVQINDDIKIKNDTNIIEIEKQLTQYDTCIQNSKY
jgi:hypothetical protein